MMSEVLFDKTNLDRMKVKIIKHERDNLRNKEKTHEEMVDLIMKIISSELKKNY